METHACIFSTRRLRQEGYSQSWIHRKKAKEKKSKEKKEGEER